MQLVAATGQRGEEISFAVKIKAAQTHINLFITLYVRLPCYQRFFLACDGELRFVGPRPTRVGPKAEDTSGSLFKTSSKPETAHEKPLAPRVRYAKSTKKYRLVYTE